MQEQQIQEMSSYTTDWEADWEFERDPWGISMYLTEALLFLLDLFTVNLYHLFTYLFIFGIFCTTKNIIQPPICKQSW